MREIIHIQGGQCGNQMGLGFWEMISDEHGVDPIGEYRGDKFIQLEKIDAYFNEAIGGRYVPRAVLFDFDKEPLDRIRTGNFGNFFKPSNFISHSLGTNDNFAQGFYNQGPCLLEKTMEIIRQEVEQCECLQGFQMTHSIGGGTGSGMGSLLISKLKEEYPDKIVITFSAVPCSGQDTEPYNSILSMHHLLENSDFSFLFDDEASCDTWKKYFKVPEVTYGYVNHHYTFAMAGVTSLWRVPNLLNSDLRKFAVNMVPFPRPHFLMVSLAPLTHRGSCQGRIQYSVAELTQQIFEPKNVLCVDPSQGRYLTGCTVYRGQASPSEVHEQTQSISNRFVEWIPNNYKSTICELNQIYQRRAATFIGNSTSIKKIFTRSISQFRRLFYEETYLYQYLNEGMDDMEFFEAETNIEDLISEYQQYEDFGKQQEIQQSQ